MKFLTPSSPAALPASDWTAPAIAVLCLLAVLGVLILRMRPWRRTRAARTTRIARPGPSLSNVRPTMSDPHSQLQAIARIDFETIPLLNSQEARLLPVLERLVLDIGQGHRVMAQTSLGEVIRPKAGSGISWQRSDAHASINSKRLDFAIFNRFGILVLAIEYQGTGHHQNNAFLRDAVKREALRKAGVAFLEVRPDFDPTLVQAQIRASLWP